MLIFFVGGGVNEGAKKILELNSTLLVRSFVK